MPRRVDGGRAGRGAGRRRAAGSARPPREQQVGGGAGLGAVGGRRPHRRRLFDEIAPARAGSIDAPAGLARPKVLVRVTPGVEAHTHEFVRTGQEDTKFGFSVASGAAAEAVAALELCRGSSWSASTPTSAARSSTSAPSSEAAEVLGAFFAPLDLAELVRRRRTRRRLRERRAGADAQAEWATATTRGLRGGRRGPGDAGDRRAGPVDRGDGRHHAATGSARSRSCPAIRTYVAVDGGMSDNPRPVLYGSGYEAFLPARRRAARPKRGPGRRQALRDRRRRRGRGPPARRPGASATSSPRRSPARTATRWPRTTTRSRGPPVVFVADGRARVVVRRETIDDLLRLDA